MKGIIDELLAISEGATDHLRKKLIQLGNKKRRLLAMSNQRTYTDEVQKELIVDE